MFDSTIQMAYVSVHALTAVGTGIIAFRTVVHSSMRAREWFGSFMLVLTVWLSVATLSLFVSHERILFACYLTRALSGALSGLLLVIFASAYTGRPIRNNPVIGALVVGFLALAAIILTSPLHDLYYVSVAVLTSPFVHLDESFGPAYYGLILYVMVCIFIVMYYFIELSLLSRHRGSTAALIIAVGLVFSLVPYLLTEGGILLVETYDHSVFGVTILATALWVATYPLGLSTVTPIARDEAIETFDDPYLAVDSNGTLVDFNDASLDVFDALDSTCLGKPLQRVAPAVQPHLPDRNETDSVETNIALTVDGNTRHFAVSISPIETPRVETQGWLILLRDITQQKERERELQRKNDRLDQFASIISHDLRNPLTVAGLQLEVARDTGDDEHFERVREAHDRMETMIDEMLTLARSDTTVQQTESVSLDDLARDAKQSVRTEQAAVEITVPENWTVEGDPTLLSHVLENLLRNAIEHNEGSITVRIDTLDGDRRGFFVADDGTGIPTEERSNVFEDGYTSSEHGTGFGLSIVREFVQAHGWKIRVTESDEGGARFEIETGRRDGSQ